MFGPNYGFSGVRRWRGAASPVPIGPVQSAAVESDGTVLALVLSGVSAGNWAGYGIASASDTMPKIALATTIAGFDRMAGQAVANAARARGLIALRPCRRAPIIPTGPLSPNGDVLDEVDNGNGTRTVRLRLSKPVYQGDTCTLALASGWRAGAPAQIGLAVTNNSGVTVGAIAGGRWLTVPKQRLTGAFRVDVMAGNVNPEGKSGLAAVKFTVTDGTTSIDVWGALSTSTAHGDSVRCWSANIDPAGLNAGLITVHKTLYPWVGASRSSGSGQSTATGSFVNGADAPLMMAYDPVGTRYPPAYVVCDPVNGTTTASAGMVQPSLAAAKAVAAASKPANVGVALNAIYQANRSATAANGGSALTRMADGATIVIPAGTTSMGTVAPTTGLSATECWPMVIGDPDDGDPRTNCILETAASTLNVRVAHLSLQNLRHNAGGANLGNNANWWLHNVQVEAKSGQGASTAWLTASTTSFIYATKVTIGSSTAVNLAQNGTAQRFALARSCSTPRALRALAIVGSTAGDSLGGWGSIGDADANADWVAVGNSVIAATSRTITWPTAPSGGYAMSIRPLVLNNVMERIGGSTEPMWSFGENQKERMINGVIEGNTFVGERTNLLYNDPADLVSTNIHVDCRVANNYFDWLPTKHDDFFDDTTAASNGVPAYPSLTGATSPYGYRPALVESLWFQDGCGCDGNVHGRRLGSASFQQKGFGRGAVVNPSSASAQGNVWSKFVSDKSRMGDDAGGGDYRPAGGSPLIGAGSAANLDVDRAGVTRGSVFAAGALEPA